MEKQPRQLDLLHVPEPPHQDARLLTRQMQQQEADYQAGLRAYVNQEQAKAFQLRLLEPGEFEPSEIPQATLIQGLSQLLAGLWWLEPQGGP